jgi:hypothetical protein
MVVLTGSGICVAFLASLLYCSLTHNSGVKSDSFIHSYQNHILLLLFCSVLGIFTCDRKKHLLLSAFFFYWYLSITFISHVSHSQPHKWHKWHKWHGINVNAEFTHHPRIKSEDIISIISSCRVLDDIFLGRFLTNATVVVQLYKCCGDQNIIFFLGTNGACRVQQFNDGTILSVEKKLIN